MSVATRTAGRGPHDVNGSATRTTVHDLLSRARQKLARLTPRDAHEAVCRGDGVIVDIRADSQIAAAGCIPGALVVPRNVLEWRACPSSGFDDTQFSCGRQRLILICAEGYQSSLAAATLQELGFVDATDVIDGAVRWFRDGLPMERRR